MKNLNLILVLFCGALLLFTFQNCQKAPLQTDSYDENSVLMIGLPQYKYKNVLLKAGAGYQLCEPECVTNTEINLNLVGKKLQIAYLKNNSNTMQNFELILKTDFILKAHALLNLLKINLTSAPDCREGSCPQLADAPEIIHSYTDFNDSILNVYYPQLLDAAPRNITIGSYDISTSPVDFLCLLRTEVKNSNQLTEDVRKDALEAVKLAGIGPLDDDVCP